jgi:hypothetical protein
MGLAECLIYLILSVSLSIFCRFCLLSMKLLTFYLKKKKSTLKDHNFELESFIFYREIFFSPYYASLTTYEPTIGTNKMFLEVRIFLSMEKLTNLGK